MPKISTLPGRKFRCWISTDSSDDSILKLYANRKSIDQVTKLDLLSESEYLVQHLDFQISNYQKQIDDLQKEESCQSGLIASTNQDIQDLEASKDYQTEEEQSQTNEKDFTGKTTDYCLPK